MGPRRPHHRIATTLAGLVADVGVHPEITAAAIHASSRPDRLTIGHRATR
jgi:hypothetical protein